MSEFPALHEALVRAAERRRRRRRTLRVSVPAFAAVAAAAVFLLAGGRPAPPEQEENFVASPLAKHFSVFGRPQTADDRAASDTVAAFAGADRDPALVRHVGRDAYVLGTNTGSVCIVLPDGQQTTGSCGPVEDVLAAPSPLAARTASTYAFLVPDGAHDAIATYGRGRRVEMPVRDNAIVLAEPDGLVALSWTNDGAVRQIVRAKPFYWAMTTRCTGQVGAAPVDAAEQAARAALLAADQLDRRSRSAEVVATDVAPRTRCSDAWNARVVRVTLRFDSGERRVFVGWADDGPRVFLLAEPGSTDPRGASPPYGRPLAGPTTPRPPRIIGGFRLRD